MNPCNLLGQQVRTEIKRRRRIFITIVFLSFLYLAKSFIFGDMGLLKYLELRERQSHLTWEIKDIQAKNSSLRSDLKLLKEDPFYREKHAREDFGMARSGEIIFEYHD